MKTISNTRKCIGIISLMVIFTSCSVHSPHDYSYVSESLKNRSGIQLRSEDSPESYKIPKGINVSDGMSEDEAVAIALWNNAQFQSDLTALGFARADLIEAGMLRNPVFSLLFPVGPKQMEYTLSLPVDFLWQRPYRVAAAKIDAEKIAESLVQNSLELVRTVRIASVNLNLAQQKAAITAEEAALEEEIAQIASARLRVGDISELEDTAFRMKAAETHDKSIQYAHYTELEIIRLVTLLGFSLSASELEIQYSPLIFIKTEKEDVMIRKALAARPDLRAVELSLESAGKKIGWETSKIFNLTAMLDANAEGKEGFEMGPGLQLELPVFNWNSGKRTRAQTELEQAARNYVTVQQKITSEVLSARTDYLTAQETVEIIKNQIVPSAEMALQKTERSYALGEISYLDLLEFRLQLLTAQSREADGEAEVRRSLANLYYSVGCDFRDLE